MIDASAASGVTITGDVLGDDVTHPDTNITNLSASLITDEAGVVVTNLLDDNSRVLNFSAAVGDLTLSSLTITGGRAADGSINSTRGENGGGIHFLSSGTLALVSSTVSGNMAGNGSTTGYGGDGGGIFLASGSLTLISSTVSGNSTGNGGNRSLTFIARDGGSGGGIFALSGDVLLRDSTVIGNTTGKGGDGRFGGDAGDGAGIYASSGAVKLIDSTVRDNATGRGGNAEGGTFAGDGGEGGSGGGVFTLSGAVVLVRSTVSGNTTGNGGVGRFGPSFRDGGDGGDGGGIYTDSSVTLETSTVSRNSTGSGGEHGLSGDGGEGGDGGGIRASGAVTLVSSTVSGNTTGDGGVGPFFNSFIDGGDGGGIITRGGAILLTNSTVSGNTTGTGGVGGGFFTSFGEVMLMNSTVTRNRATSRGGAAMGESGADPDFTVVNSIVAGNTSEGSFPDLRSDLTNVLLINHSLIGVADGLAITGNVGNRNGTAAIPLDPLLMPLADNGGATWTHALLPDSPAIDTGAPDFNLAADTPSLYSDQRGPLYVRVAGERIDIGSFELQPEPAFVRGDYNRDSVVDSADYTIWRDSLGVTGLSPFVGADGDGDGEVTSLDYRIWGFHFGFKFPENYQQEIAESNPASVIIMSLDEVVERPSDAAFADTATLPDGRLTPHRRLSATAIHEYLSNDYLLLLAKSLADRQLEEEVVSSTREASRAFKVTEILPLEGQGPDMAQGHCDTS